jgi:hypothetical protein
MAARSAFYKVIDDDTELAALGFDVTYQQNAVDAPDEDRFVVLRWEQTGLRLYDQNAPDRCLVCFHDKDRDYGQIDLAIQRVKQIVRDALHVSGGDGWVMTQASWVSDGPDLFDDGFKTVTRWTEITVNSRYDGPVPD